MNNYLLLMTLFGLKSIIICTPHEESINPKLKSNIQETRNRVQKLKKEYQNQELEELKKQKEPVEQLQKETTGARALLSHPKMHKQLQEIAPKIDLVNPENEHVQKTTDDLILTIPDHTDSLEKARIAVQKNTEFLSTSGNLQFNNLDRSNSTSKPLNSSEKKEQFLKKLKQTQQSLDDLFKDQNTIDLKESLVQHIKELLHPLSSHKEYQKTLDTLNYAKNPMDSNDIEVFDTLRKYIQKSSARKQLKSQIDQVQNLFDQYAFEISKKERSKTIQSQAIKITPYSSNRDIEDAQQKIQNSMPEQFLNSPKIQKVNQEYKYSTRKGTTYEQFIEWIKALLQALKDLKYTINQGIAKEILNSIKPQYRNKTNRA